MSMDPAAWLSGGTSAPSAAFPTPGTTVTGEVIAPAPFLQQQRDLATGAPKTFGNGDPMMQMVVTLRTDLRDPAVPDDDGTRRLYVKSQMRNAVAEAVRQAGANGIDVGGRLAVTFTHEDAPQQRGFNGAKNYTAQYQPPSPAGQFLQQPQPQAPQQVQQQPVSYGQQPLQPQLQQQPVAQPPVPAMPTGAQLPAGITAEQLAALQAAGLLPAS